MYTPRFKRELMNTSLYVIEEQIMKKILFYVTAQLLNIQHPVKKKLEWSFTLGKGEARAIVFK